MSEKIEFLLGRNSFLDNTFSLIEFEGIKYPTLWHAHRAMQLPFQYDRQKVTKLTLRQLGELQYTYKGMDYELATMQKLLKIKFGLEICSGNNINLQMDLAKKLVATGSSYIEFGNTDCDIAWGMCHCSKHRRILHSPPFTVWYDGENRLGKLLMRTRLDWRTYIEEVNEMEPACENCDKPSDTLVFFTPKDQPTQPKIVGACGNHVPQVFQWAADHSSDRRVMRYPDEDDLEETFTVKSIIDGHTCPDCKLPMSLWAPYCYVCHTTKHHNAIPEVKPTQLALPASCDVRTPNTPTEREYKTKVIRC